MCETPRSCCLKGGGVQPQFIVKIVFEIAVDQQTITNDQTFEGVPDPNRPPLSAVQPRPYLVYLWPNYAKSRNMPKTQILDAVLVAIGLLNSYMNFYPDWIKMVELWANNLMPIYGQWAYAPNLIDFDR